MGAQEALWREVDNGTRTLVEWPDRVAAGDAELTRADATAVGTAIADIRRELDSYHAAVATPHGARTTTAASPPPPAAPAATAEANAAALDTPPPAPHDAPAGASPLVCSLAALGVLIGTPAAARANPHAVAAAVAVGLAAGVDAHAHAPTDAAPATRAATPPSPSAAPSSGAAMTLSDGSPTPSGPPLPGEMTETPLVACANAAADAALATFGTSAALPPPVAVRHDYADSALGIARPATPLPSRTPSRPPPPPPPPPLPPPSAAGRSPSETPPPTNPGECIVCGHYGQAGTGCRGCGGAIENERLRYRFGLWYAGSESPPPPRSVASTQIEDDEIVGILDEQQEVEDVEVEEDIEHPSGPSSPSIPVGTLMDILDGTGPDDESAEQSVGAITPSSLPGSPSLPARAGASHPHRRHRASSEGRYRETRPYRRRHAP